MQDNLKSWLNDILTAIDQIFDFLPEENNFNNFQNDIKTKKAVLLNILIIGEAVNRIIKSNSNCNISNARKIVDTRNRIIHGYDSVSDDIIWAIIIKELPKLKKEIGNLLEL